MHYLLLLLLLFSSLTYADKSGGGSASSYNIAAEEEEFDYSSHLSYLYSKVQERCTGYSITYYDIRNIGTRSKYGDYYLSATISYRCTNTAIPDIDTSKYPFAAGVPLTDAQCQAQYAAPTTLLVSDSDIGPYERNGCTLSSVGVSPCTYVDSLGNSAPSGMCYLYGDVNAVSNGDIATMPSTDTALPDAPLPPYLTETDDPASCGGSSMSTGGKSYCVDQSQIDNGNVTYIDFGGSDGDSDSGGSDGGSSGGDSGSDGGTDGGSDTGGGGSGGGGSSGGGSGDGGSTGGDSGSDDGSSDDGEGLDGVIDAIASVRNAINDGFQGLVDKVTGVTDAVDDVKESVDEGNQAAEDRFSAMADGAPTEADYEAKYGSDEGNADLVNQAVEGLGSDLGKYVDGTDSTLTGVVGDMQSWGQSVIPSVPAPSCAPLVFAPGEVYSFTIDCEIFELIRAALAWILYALTAYVVVTTMFNSRPH